MALRIQKRKNTKKDGTISTSWRLINRDYSLKTPKDIYVDKADYYKYGLNCNDPIEIALGKLKIVQSSNKLKREASLKAKIDKRIQNEALIESTYLPSALYEEFTKWLMGYRAWGETIPKKSQSHLRCMRKIIKDIDTAPDKWPKYAHLIYNWFVTKGLSLSYVEKVLPLLNLYGYFYCSHFDKPFLKLNMPPSVYSDKIEEANKEKRNGKTNESLPLKLSDLEKIRNLKEEQQNWIKMSFFFGLRPFEVDRLSHKNRNKIWKLEIDEEKTIILAVDQLKLKRLKGERRWKRIPCLLEDQIELVALLDSNKLPLKRPIAKYLQRHLGDGQFLYSGRKGFEPLMRNCNQKKLHIKQWEGRTELKDVEEDIKLKTYDLSDLRFRSEMLGHSDIDRTRRHYTDPKAVDYSPIKKTNR